MSFPLEAAVLVGGHSRRMGQDKAQLSTPEGLPWWKRQVLLLEALDYHPIRLLGRPAQALKGAPPLLEDLYPDQGPLGGLATALQTCTQGHLALLAVDMQLIGPEWFHLLETFLRPGCGAYFKGVEGAEPLAAIYPREALGHTQRALAAGRRSLQDCLGALGAQGLMTALPLPELLLYQSANYNSAGDLSRFKPRQTSP